MNQKECTRRVFVLARFVIILVAALGLVGCKSAETSKAEHVQRGEAFLKEKKYQEATIEFRNAIQIDDRLAPAHWGLAQAYEGLQRFAEMMDELKRTIDLDANNLDARVKLGTYYVGANAIRKSDELVAEADRLVKEVLQKDPNHIAGQVLLADVLFAQGKRPEALAALNRAIELDPKRVESVIALAKYYIRTNDIAKAEEIYRRAISVNEASALAHSEYAKFLVQAGRVDQAEAEFRRAVEVEPQNRDARFVLASFYLVNKRLDKAEEAYKALAELDKDKPEGRYILADFYSSVGRYDDAISIYQEIMGKSPDYTRGRYRMAEIMLQRGDARGATEQVDQVLRTNPRDMQALLLRSRIHLQGGDPDGPKKAIEDLKEVLKQEPNSRSGLYFMAEATFRAGRVEQARVFAGDLAKYYPDYLPAKLMQAQINLATKDAVAAVVVTNELMDRLSKEGPTADLSPQMLAELRQKTLTARGVAQLQLGKVKQAREDLTAARDIAPNAPSSYNNLALVALFEKNTDEATALYERSLAIDNANFDALNGLINNVYSRQQRLDQAHARVDQALAARPNSPALHYLKAHVYGFEQNAQGAEGELRRALEIDPNYLAAYFDLAALFVNTKQQDRAIAEYRQIIARRPDDASTYTLIGMLEDSRNNTDAAIENYRKALELDPNSAIAANNLAWAYAVHGKGNLDEAVALAQGVVQRFPEVPGFADTLGWVYYKKGLHDSAVEQLQKVVDKAGDSAGYRFHLGMALAGKGDKAAARRELEQALRLGEKQPSFTDAEEARRTLATL
ncbi:MAG TPA: tetratricopeptide repeat protein [Pyrinomonadaceae bacterium]|nr:tetratricopeptide repeat protein [Pyrinomonadaceae bacterium]